MQTLQPCTGVAHAGWKHTGVNALNILYMSQLQYSYIFDYIAPEHSGLTTGLTDRYLRVHAQVPLTHSSRAKLKRYLWHSGPLHSQEMSSSLSNRTHDVYTWTFLYVIVPPKTTNEIRYQRGEKSSTGLPIAILPL